MGWGKKSKGQEVEKSRMSMIAKGRGCWWSWFDGDDWLVVVGWGGVGPRWRFGLVWWIVER